MTQALYPSTFAFLPDPGNFLRGLLFMVKVALFWLLMWLLFTSCATTRPRPAQEPLLAVKPALQLDSLPEPEVNFDRPDYARSIPKWHVNPPDTAQQPTQKAGFKAFVNEIFGAKSTQIRGNSTRKDKRRITYNIYNGPNDVKNSTLATDHGTVVKTDKNVDRSKDQSDHDNDNHNQANKKADLGQKATTKTGFVVPGWVWLVLLLVLGFVFCRQLVRKKT